MRFCVQNSLLYADLVCQLTVPDVRILYASTDGAAVRIPGCDMLAATTPESAARLLAFVAGDRDVVLHESFLLPALRAQGFICDLVCRQAVYARRAAVAAELPDGVTIREMTMEELPFVVEHYHMPVGEEYLAERMRAGMLGIYVCGACAGFIGTHMERSMGMLEILPAYRRAGLAYLLEGAMIDRILARGETPYCQVQEENEASLRLQHKLGLSMAEGRVYWMSKTTTA